MATLQEINTFQGFLVLGVAVFSLGYLFALLQLKYLFPHFFKKEDNEEAKK